MYENNLSIFNIFTQGLFYGSGALMHKMSWISVAWAQQISQTEQVTALFIISFYFYQLKYDQPLAPSCLTRLVDKTYNSILCSPIHLCLRLSKYHA